MASIGKHGDGWRAQVFVKGKRATRVFRTQREARAWADNTEAEFRAPPKAPASTRTLRDLLERYRDEVTPKKETSRTETNRINAFLRDFPEIADKLLQNLDTPDLAAWRDKRLSEVKSGTVHRDITWLRAALNKARLEWRWLDTKPFDGLEIPADSPERESLWGWRDIRAMFDNAGYRPGRKPENATQEAILAFHVALRTGMRSGEVLQLGARTLDLGKRIAVVEHKTQRYTGKPRRVPLLSPAIRLLKPFSGQERIFTIGDADRDALFRKVRDRLMLRHLDFHDSRATALTHMSRKVPVQVLSRISGHKDIRILVNRYYRESAEDIAKRFA